MASASSTRFHVSRSHFTSLVRRRFTSDATMDATTLVDHASALRHNRQRRYSTSATMDAATLVAAALPVGEEESRDAAMLALLQERERLAMSVADQDSYLSQRPQLLHPW